MPRPLACSSAACVTAPALPSLSEPRPLARSSAAFPWHAPATRTLQRCPPPPPPPPCTLQRCLPLACSSQLHAPALLVRQPKCRLPSACPDYLHAPALLCVNPALPSLSMPWLLARSSAACALLPSLGTPQPLTHSIPACVSTPACLTGVLQSGLLSFPGIVSSSPAPNIREFSLRLTRRRLLMSGSRSSADSPR